VRPGTTVHQREPLNAEPPRAALAEAPFTPLDAFYVRNHGPVPAFDPTTWRLEVGGLVERPLSLALDDLRALGEADLVATLQCAGNRRAGLIAVRDIPGEAPWGPGATATGRWTGVPLGAVLRAAGVRAGTEHVALVGADVSEEVDPPQPFGVSIPLGKAQAPEVLLAWALAGEPLSALHGAPLRAVVPGYVGARSVKWLARVELRAEPWDGFFQAVGYRLLPPDGEPAPGAGVPLGEVSVNADILTPDDGARVGAGRVVVRGYAFAGGARHVARVDVYADGGATWRDAALLDDLGPWAWRLWEATVELDAGEHELVVRAWDSAAGVQPEDPATVWNPKGYVNSTWARVRVTAGSPPAPAEARHPAGSPPAPAEPRHPAGSPPAPAEARHPHR
jgi:sulfite oxidase